MKEPNMEARNDMHELTKKILNAEEAGRLNHCQLSRSGYDSIIRGWLAEKVHSWDGSTGLCLQLLKNHFGLSKRSCKCGACKLEDAGWIWNDVYVYRTAVIHFCPSCGERLQGE